MANGASHRYFRPKEGRWRGRFFLSITDWGSFWSAPVGWLDRGCVLGAAYVPRLIGPLWIETSVEYASRGEQGEVRHTTRIFKWGMTFFRSTEIFSLDENGRDLLVHGEQRIWPLLWRARSYQDSAGQIDESGTRATYSLTWLGGKIEQRTEPQGEALKVEQRSSWSHATFVLHHLPR